LIRLHDYDSNHENAELARAGHPHGSQANKNPGITKLKKIRSHLPMIAALEMALSPATAAATGKR